MAGLTLRLLGGCEVTDASGAPLVLATKKARALLCYLALNRGEPLRRADLAMLLWGERFDEQARASLRQTIYELRNALGATADSLIETSRESLSLRDHDLEIDVARFELLAASDDAEDLAEAGSLYRGPLLKAFETGEAGFDDWLAAERTRLHELACNSLARLAGHALDAGDSDEASRTARNLLAIDPLGEAGHRLLMRALAAGGRRHDALKQFHALEALLQAELGVQPEPKTRAVYDAVMKGTKPPGVKSTSSADRINSSEAAAVAKAPGSEDSWKRPTDRSAWPSARPLSLAAAALLAILGAATFVFLEHLLPVRDSPLPLPDKPSIAVLPFDNLTGDSEQGFFVDGFTENIITELSRDRALFVIARHSTFTYKGREVGIAEVAKELGVRYVLEGSIQRDPERLRVSAQLIDATKQAHVWSERYDRSDAELFSVQDAIVRRIVATLRGYKGSIQKAELQRSFAKPPASLTAYENLMRGMMHKERFIREDNEIARRYFATAISLDPDFALAYGWLAWTHFFDVYMGWGEDPAAALERTFDAARRSVQLDPDLDFAHWALGAAYLASGENAQALGAFERALALNPNNSDVLANTAWPYAFRGEPDKGIENVKTAMRLNPHHPDWYWWGLGIAYFAAGRHEDVVQSIGRMTQQNSESLAYLISSLVAIGDLTAAETRKRALIDLEPDFSISRFASTLTFEQPRVSEKLLAGLRAVGLPKETAGAGWSERADQGR